MITVTHHAIDRFIERVRHCSFEDARNAILSHERAIEAAIAFGAEVVRCADGSRLVLQGSSVVTVHARGDLPHQCRAPLHGGQA